MVVSVCAKGFGADYPSTTPLRQTKPNGGWASLRLEKFFSGVCRPVNHPIY